MMGNYRTDEKGKAPASADSASSRGRSPHSGLTILDGNVDDDAFDSLLDMSLSFAELEDFHLPFAEGAPQTITNPKGYSTNSNSFQNPQINMSSNAILPDWNMSWGQQNQGHNAISAGGISNSVRESGFVSFNRPQVNRDISDSSLLFHPKEFAPVHTRNNVKSQSGIQENFEGGFLSLQLGGTEESVSRSQLSSREVSAKLKEAASNELKMATGQEVTGQTLDAGFMDFQSKNSLDHFRDEKLKEAVSTELKMVHARKATSQSLNAGLLGFQSNTSGFSNRLNNVNGMHLTNNEVGVHQILQMQQNDRRDVRSGDLHHYRAFIGNQPVHSGTIGGNSAQVFNYQQHNLNKPPKFEKPSRLASYMRSTTVNDPNYAGQVITQNAIPTQVLGIGSNMLSQRTAAPQVSWVASGPAGIEEPFPKRLGVEFNVRNNLQSNQRHLPPTHTGQLCQYPDKGSGCLTDHVLRRSFGRTDGAPVSYPINSLEPVFAHGQSQHVLTHLANPQVAPFANAAYVTGQPQKPDLHLRPYHKRSAVVPHPESRGAQRQKMIHPSVHHSMPKPYMPTTTAHFHPSIPVASRTQPADPVAARIRPVVPYASLVKPRVPVANSPAVYHITSKDPEATPKLSGYKCYLCKRDLALTSEGPVYQPAAPPAVAILPCGHSFHDQCLQNITPDDQATDPPCIPCAIGEP